MIETNKHYLQSHTEVSFRGNEKQGNIWSGPTPCILPAQRDSKDMFTDWNTIKHKIVKKSLKGTEQVMWSLPSGGSQKFKLQIEEKGSCVPRFDLQDYNLV